MRFNTCNYSVVINLQSAEFCLHQNQIAALEKRLEKINSSIPSFNDICTLKNGVLRYESISIIPPKTGSKKQKVLLVLGNPSIMSVKHGMLFYSRRDGGRHGFWGKLARAKLVAPVVEDTREREAACRWTQLLEDSASPTYCVGFTTFYSFPTPGSDDEPFCGSAGVEKLFEPVLKQIRLQETRRLLSLPFIRDSILVFTRKSLLKHFYKTTGIKPSYWPIRGEDSSGDELADLLSRARKVRSSATPLLF